MTGALPLYLIEESVLISEVSSFQGYLGQQKVLISGCCFIYPLSCVPQCGQLP